MSIKKTHYKNVAVLLFSCPNDPGIVYAISQFILDHHGDILELDEYVSYEDNTFFLRLSWDLKNFSIPLEHIDEAFLPIGGKFMAKWRIKFLGKDIRTAIFVSKFDHCLQEILWRYEQREIDLDIPLIISNHDTLAHLAEQHHIPFYVFPIDAENKAKQERDEINLMDDYGINNIILARYMQVLTSNFVNQYPNRIINIHHSFLPAFIGSNPYQQAYARGVKIIGATSHYVTSDLDCGPIIEQDIVRITHKDDVDDIVRKGRELERAVLMRAIMHYAERRILVYGNKTIVFA